MIKWQSKKNYESKSWGQIGKSFQQKQKHPDTYSKKQP